MPYSHFHNWSYHTHHRRPKGGNHYNAVRRRQRPWRIGFIVALVAGVISSGAVIAMRFDAQREEVKSFATEMVEAQSERKEAWQQTRTANATAKESTRVANAARQQEQHERTIVSLINQERSQRGIGTLTWDPGLQAIARAHSRDMADKNYFSHTNKSGLGYRERAVAAGYRCRNPKWQGVAENLYFGSVGYQTPAAAVASWLDSPLHKRAMLDTTFTKGAIGIHEGHLGGYGHGYFTTLLLC